MYFHQNHHDGMLHMYHTMEVVVPQQRVLLQHGENHKSKKEEEQTNKNKNSMSIYKISLASHIENTIIAAPVVTASFVLPRYYYNNGISSTSDIAQQTTTITTETTAEVVHLLYRKL